MLQRRICFVVIALICFANISAAENVPPSFAEAANEFVPAGYKIADQVQGDFNGDGRPDLALVLWVDRESEKPRLLIVLLRQPDGRYTVSLRSDGAVPTPGCGIANPYCVPDLKYKQGALSISWRSGAGMSGSLEEYEFRLLNTDWYVTGAGATDWSPEGCLNDSALKLQKGERCTSHGTDTDLLTGKQTEYWSIGNNRNQKERIVRIDRAIPKQELKRVADFKPE
jgi:hypothetical protein